MIFLLSNQLFSNELINSEYDRYYEYLELTGLAESPALLYHSFSANNWVLPDELHPWEKRFELDKVIFKNNWMNLKIEDPEFFFTYNSAQPDGFNDGAMWQGKGFNGRFRAGFSFNSEYFSILYYPEIWFSQNLPFSYLIPGVYQPDSDFGYFQSNLDYPQRMGDLPFLKYSWGQTDIRFNYKAFTLGISTENIWLGPAEQNALILSNNSDGFPHLDIGFNKTDTVLGELEARLWWGILSESEYYNSDSSDDYRLYSGLVAAYSPVFIPGLTLGATWVVNSPGGEFGASYFFPRTLLLLGLAEYVGNDDLDQKISLTGEWTFPSVGFSAYFEWAREDFSPNAYYIVLAPEHSSFFTIGFKKSLPINEFRGFMLNGEVSELLQSRDYEIDLGSGGSYYTHHVVVHGYTNDGQILGAAVGPGSDTQYMGITYYDKWGSVTFYFRRISWDEMYLYKDPQSGDIRDRDRLNVEMDFALSSNIFLGNFNLFGEFCVSPILNDMYIKDNHLFNIHLELGLQYRF